MSVQLALAAKDRQPPAHPARLGHHSFDSDNSTASNGSARTWSSPLKASAVLQPIRFERLKGRIDEPRIEGELLLSVPDGGAWGENCANPVGGDGEGHDGLGRGQCVQGCGSWADDQLAGQDLPRHPLREGLDVRVRRGLAGGAHGFTLPDRCRTGNRRRRRPVPQLTHTAPRTRLSVKPVASTVDAEPCQPRAHTRPSQLLLARHRPHQPLFSIGTVWTKSAREGAALRQGWTRERTCVHRLGGPHRGGSRPGGRSGEGRSSQFRVRFRVNAFRLARGPGQSQVHRPVERSPLLPNVLRFRQRVGRR